MTTGRIATTTSVAILVIVLGAWQLVTGQGLVSDRLLPSPVQVAGALATLLQRGYFWDEFWSTLSVIGGGFALSAAAGFVLALLLSLSDFVRKGLYPVVVALDVIPKVTLIPVIVVTFGFGQTSRIIVVLISAFFPVFISTLSAMTDADPSGNALLRSMGASRLQQLRMYRIPQGLPAIFAGVKVSLTVSFIAGVVAELLIRNQGMGYLIIQFRQQLQVDNVFAVTIAIGLLGMALFFLMESVERRLVFWSDADRRGLDAVPL